MNRHRNDDVLLPYGIILAGTVDGTTAHMRLTLGGNVHYARMMKID